VALAERAIELGETLGLDGQDAKMAFIWGIEAALALGDREHALGLVGRIDAMPPGLRPPSLVAHAHRARARLAESADAAVVHHGAAVAGFDDLGIPFWAAVSRLEHGEALAAAGRHADAEPLLAAARETFAEFGAAPWVERVERATARGSAEPVG
jgi:hypothetical protein